MSTTDSTTTTEAESIENEHPGDLAHKYVRGEIKLSDIPTEDFDDRDVNRFRADLKIVTENAGVLPSEKVERAGKALQEVLDPAE